MKPNLKKTVLIISGLIVGGQLLAQTPGPTKTTTVFNDYVKPFSDEDAFRTWSIGVSVGDLTTNSIFASNYRQDFTSPKVQIGYDAYIKKQILPSFGLQADFLAGKLQAGNAQPLIPYGASPYPQFNTKLGWSASLSGNFTLANINWHYQKSFVQPYITLGGGLMGYTPVLTTPDGKASNFKPDNNGHIKEFFIPVGAGLKFDLVDGLNLDLGYQVNFVNSDNVDGYDHGSGNDKFSYVHIGLEFALGNRSAPQLATHNPVASMRMEYMNQQEVMQNSLLEQQIQLNAQKAKNDQLKIDLDITSANLAKLTADSDDDGVPDFYDKCPNTPAGTKVDGSGCPLPENKPVNVYITEEDKKVVKDAIKNLEFDFDKATLRDHSLPSLDKVAQLLIDKNFSLKLAGHTDNVGSSDANLILSKARAEAIRTYLVSKGANASRIEATGYGETQPIASNKTAKGRQVNRRVEFTLF